MHSHGKCVKHIIEDKPMKNAALRYTFSVLILSCGAGYLPHAEAAPTAASDPQSSTPQTITLAEQGRNPAEFPAYVEKLKSQARKQGISNETLAKAFANIHFVDRVIQSDRNQLEKKITLDDYLTRVITPAKIKQARSLAKQHRSELEKVSANSGVQSRYIVALWAMESNFGKLQGKEDVISALATLAFEGRREAFFTNELMSALKIIQRGDVRATQMKGSWAGAMGQNQFMPSSLLRYGKDGDGDGKIDIWNNTRDVFASTANYLAVEGWERGGAWGYEVKLPAGFNSSLLGTSPEQGKSVAQWKKLGITLPGGAHLPVSSKKAWLVRPDDGLARSFLVYNNFRTLMHWNRSYYFAISIGKMADAIAR